MTADADVQADADAQADQREDADAQADADTQASEREETEADASEPEDAKVEHTDDPERPRQDESMSEANTDTDLPDESATDLAIRRNLYRAALALFALLAVVAVIQLYGSVNQTINTFVAQEYRSLFRAAFNLVVLLVAGIGISWCVRELAGE